MFLCACEENREEVHERCVNGMNRYALYKHNKHIKNQYSVHTHTNTHNWAQAQLSHAWGKTIQTEYCDGSSTYIPLVTSQAIGNSGQSQCRERFGAVFKQIVYLYSAN